MFQSQGTATADGLTAVSEGQSERRLVLPGADWKREQMAFLATFHLL